MAIQESVPNTQPPDELIAALDHLDAWERGEAIEFSPEGLAFLHRLQRARLGRLSLANSVAEAEL
jgi:hypothetical protein